jgi:hypothetical protein
MLHIRVVTTPGRTGRLLGPRWRPHRGVHFRDHSEAGGSALQLLLNVVLLIVVGAAGLSAQRVLWARRYPRERAG